MPSLHARQDLSEDEKGTVKKKKSISSSLFNIMVEDEDAFHPEKISKVFCSQSVVLMLRNALDPGGNHAPLLAMMNSLNSRLASPKQVHEMLSRYGAVQLSNDDLAKLAFSD
jgi:hypothetical protein